MHRRLLVIAILMIALLPLHAREPKVRKNMLVTTEWLAKNVAKEKTTVLAIGRDRKNYDAGHIPGAQFVALTEFTAKRSGVPNELPGDAQLTDLIQRLGIDKRHRIVLYDDADGLLAARMYFTLDYAGLGDRAALLDGGWKKWMKEQRLTSTEAPAARERSTFTLKPKPELVVKLGRARPISRALVARSANSIALVDARPADEYSGETPGDQITRPGHIPGAVNLFWKRALASEEMPTLKPATQLRALYAAAGVPPGVQVVTYCRTGVQAAHGYFVAKYLGYDTRLYDGSFVEWSMQQDTPVAAGPSPAGKISASAEK